MISRSNVCVRQSLSASIGRGLRVCPSEQRTRVLGEAQGDCALHDRRGWQRSRPGAGTAPLSSKKPRDPSKYNPRTCIRRRLEPFEPRYEYLESARGSIGQGWVRFLLFFMFNFPRISHGLTCQNSPLHSPKLRMEHHTSCVGLVGRSPGQ